MSRAPSCAALALPGTRPSPASRCPSGRHPGGATRPIRPPGGRRVRARGSRSARLCRGSPAEPPQKVRQSFLQALEVAREAGLEEKVRPLVEIRLADLKRLAPEAPRPAEPDA